MKAIEIARKLAAHQQVEDARRAYLLVIQGSEGKDPEGELEAALYLLQSGGDHRVAYTSFVSLYNRGLFQEDLLQLMTEAFYQPNVKLQKARYEKNRKLLGKYPYLFRRDFPAFEDLPIQFFPYDDDGFVPYDKARRSFGGYVNFNHPVVSRNYFQDLEKPILAADVYSQYELEYLRDNVRKSEWVGRENHVYLHYTDWETFCAHLQVLNLRPVLEEEKVVFLIEDEIGQYPIDFKERFGIDYSQYPVKPVGIREVKRLIWHTQLSSHNGGDFFNEVFHNHPNLIWTDSLMFDESIDSLRKQIAELDEKQRNHQAVSFDASEACQPVLRELTQLKNRTEKDFLVTNYLCAERDSPYLDHSARIAPALFFQPHFTMLIYDLEVFSDGAAQLSSEDYDNIRHSPLMKSFPYIKAFTPMRRVTSSYGGSVKYMLERMDLETGKVINTGGKKDGKYAGIRDLPSICVLNRSFMIDWQDRLFQDCVLVRFEDGKLNPKATFTALAAFLDIPYTESMTYCSNESGINPESTKGNARGFDPASIYKTYEDYSSPAERYYIEYLMRDVYDYYGYSLRYYDGAPVDEEKAKGLVQQFDTIDGYVMQSTRAIIYDQLKTANVNIGKMDGDGELSVSEDNWETIAENTARRQVAGYRENRLFILKTLSSNLRFVNGKGQPLHMMPQLQLDPALLEQPVYH